MSRLRMAPETPWSAAQIGGGRGRSDVKRLLKLFRYELKAQITLGAVVWKAVWTVLVVWAVLSEFLPAHFVVSLLTALLIFPGLSLSLTKPDVDFVFATQADPAEVRLLRAAATVLSLLPVVVAVSALFVLTSPGGLLWYAISLVFLSIFSILMVAAVGSISLRSDVRLVLGILTSIASYVRPELFPTYGLVNPSPLYAAYSGALAALMYAFFPWKRVRELAVNAYGVLAVAVPRVSEPEERAAARAQFGTPWRAVWVTSSTYYRRRGEMFIRASALKTGLVISLVAAAAGYAAARLSPPDLAEVVLAFQSFFVFVMFFVFAADTILRERLWLSLSGDADLYFRFRMLARSALAAVFVTPLVVEAAALAPFFPPALHLIPGLVSIPLVVPAASWLAAAYAGWPQMRELDLQQSPPGTSHRSYLAILMVMAYYLFAFAPYYMAVAASYIGDLSHLLYAAAQVWSAVLLLLSALFFYATTLSRWRRTVWSWFVNKLSENGYV
ncbi:MAG: hypothetical protein ACO2PN_02090 [Pyrobaculum sp.]